MQTSAGPFRSLPALPHRSLPYCPPPPLAPFPSASLPCLGCHSLLSASASCRCPGLALGPVLGLSRVRLVMIHMGMYNIDSFVLFPTLDHSGVPSWGVVWLFLFAFRGVFDW